MPHTINRNALIVYPKQELYNWVNDHNPEENHECPETLGYDDANVYLIPDYAYPEEAIQHVKEDFLTYFMNEIKDWDSPNTVWPENLSWELFNQWFHFSVQSVVMDTAEDEPMEMEWF